MTSSACSSTVIDSVRDVYQRSFIKIEVLRGTSGKDIYGALRETCADIALSETCADIALSFKTVYRWFAQFKSGKYDICDESRSVRDVTVTDKYHVEKVKELLATNRRYTCNEIASRVGWLPHCLTEAQIQERLNSAKDLIERYEKEGERFLNRFVAIDETWVMPYEPELKPQSSKWHTPASPRPAKFRTSQASLKMLMIFAYDNSGVHHF